ncbi:MAG: TetR/AcrR family transcriptional regulator [Deltaproteobacteria bacterium]|nr:TetR/AcrR family transcriptional regulator [Deltaproteobacteria bacterium]MBW2686867.1 TetR/AcrR family transcriptional regulator [Deltaproteobacteria bacterium]
MPPRPQLKPRKRPSQARSKATVEAILVAAAQVFQRHGYVGATTDRIAERAGVSVGSLYQYFPNKDAILVALTERHINAGFALVRELLAEALNEAPPLERLLRQFVVAMIALHEQEPELHRVLFEEAPLPPSVRRQLRKRENEFATEVCAFLRAHPEARRHDAKATAYVVVHTVDALVHNFILHPPEGLGSDALTEEIVRMLLGHLTTNEAS